MLPHELPWQAFGTLTRYSYALPRGLVHLERLEVLDETWPAREPVFARDRELRVGELELVRLRLGAVPQFRVDALERFSVSLTQLPEQPFRLLPLELQVGTGGKRADVGWRIRR